MEGSKPASLAEKALGKHIDPNEFGGKQLMHSVVSTNSNEKRILDQYARVPELKDEKLALASGKNGAPPHEWFSNKLMSPNPLSKLEGMIVKDETDGTEWKIFLAGLTIPSENVGFLFDSHLEHPECVFTMIRPKTTEEDMTADDHFFTMPENTRYMIRKPSGKFQTLDKSQLNKLRPRNIRPEDVLNRRILKSRDGSKKRIGAEPTPLFLDRRLAQESIQQFNTLVEQTKQPPAMAAPSLESMYAVSDFGSVSTGAPSVKDATAMFEAADAAIKKQQKVIGEVKKGDKKDKDKKGKKGDKKDKDKKKKKKKSKSKGDDDEESDDETVEIASQSEDESSSNSSSGSDSGSGSSGSSSSESDSKKSKKSKKKDKGKSKKDKKKSKSKEDKNNGKRKKDKDSSESESEKEDSKKKKQKTKAEEPVVSSPTPKPNQEANPDFSLEDLHRGVQMEEEAGVKKKSSGGKKGKKGNKGDDVSEESSGDEDSKKEEKPKSSKKSKASQKKGRPWPKGERQAYVLEMLKGSWENKSKGIKNNTAKNVNPLASLSDAEMLAKFSDWFKWHTWYSDPVANKLVPDPLAQIGHRDDWKKTAFEMPKPIIDSLKSYMALEYFFNRTFRKTLPRHDEEKEEASKGDPGVILF